MKPTFKHDCDQCTFLGTVIIDDVVQDLYYCAKEPTVISRTSDEGGDYSSGLCFGKSALVRYVNDDARGNKGLMVAYTLAMAHGWNLDERFRDTPIIEDIVEYKKTLW